MLVVAAEFGEVLDRRSYGDEPLGETEQQEIHAAVRRGRRFITAFNNDYLCLVEDKLIHPESIAGRLLAEVGAAIHLYAEEYIMDVNKVTQIQEGIQEVIQSSFSEYTPFFNAALANRHHSLCWTGPPIQIAHREEYLPILMGKVFGLNESRCYGPPDAPPDGPPDVPRDGTPDLSDGAVPKKKARFGRVPSSTLR